MTITQMLDEKICEQLCAFMDGELSEVEARFLLRRLEHDGELRAKWERLQLASACLKNQSAQLMATGFCDSVYAQLSEPVRVSQRHRPFFGLAIAASLAVVAVLYAPRLLHKPMLEVVSESTLASRTVIPSNPVASPASADLVAASAKVPVDSETVAISRPIIKETAIDNANRSDTPKKSPLPLTAQSPEEFPLVDNGDKKTWPRSISAISANDPALEAYLVRHNQMLTDDSFGGFFPYVDVVANEQAHAINQDSEGNSQ